MRRLLVLAVALTVALAIAMGTASGAGTTVRATNFAFHAKTLTIQKGDTVTWKDVEGKHTVTFKNGITFDKVISARHPRVSKTFRQRGTFRYICRFHKSLGMTGKVIVQ